MEFKYNIGDNVIYIGETDKFTWKPVKYKKHEIENRLLNSDGYPFYLITENDIFYREGSFISIKEYRKLKLKKITKN